jgi:hypothetical protein
MPSQKVHATVSPRTKKSSCTTKEGVCQLTAEVNALLEINEEGWQTVKTKRSRPCTMHQLDSEAHQQQGRRSLYIRKIKGLYFNFLTRDHKGASCHDPTGCWHYRRFSHPPPPLTEYHPSSCVKSLNSCPCLNSGTLRHNHTSIETLVPWLMASFSPSALHRQQHTR